MKKTKTANEYYEENTAWHKELYALRKVLCATELEETVKWGVPTYTINGKNVIGIAAFKSYVGLWFHNGALLTDKTKVLLNAQEGKTVALRQWRFENINDIDEKLVKAYVLEAIANQKENKTVSIPKKKEITAPFLITALAEDEKLQTSFNALTKGRQKEYHEFIAEAKQESTKQRRLDKIIPLILEGKGLNDKYK
ncbi:YdeI/OmpD-associated family protein [Joostella sp. CR20]|uniref:YdeI/OmpD-associated family protein n=1 Tax=Joostella sp. CR20 TaxID=2804312 RepID=UPI00313D0C6D